LAARNGKIRQAGRGRACQRIGQISKELEKVVTVGGGKVGIPTDGKPKEQQLKEAGISTSIVNRYEELVGDWGGISECK
jgi:hypothetical protein